MLAPRLFRQVAGLHRASPSATLDKSFNLFGTNILYHFTDESQAINLKISLYAGRVSLLNDPSVT